MLRKFAPPSLNPTAKAATGTTGTTPRALVWLAEASNQAAYYCTRDIAETGFAVAT